MAKQEILLSGKAGPVVYYTRLGVNCIRTMPARVRQSDATKKRSANFSIASTAARFTRAYLVELFSWPDSMRFNRLTGAFSLWLKGSDLQQMPAGPMEHVQDFKINPLRMISHRWRESIIVKRNETGLQINISELLPEALMALPDEAHTIRLQLSSLLLQLPRVVEPKVVSSTITIPVRQLFSGLTIQHQLPVDTGTILLAGFSVQLLNNHSRPVAIRKGYSFPAEMLYAEWMGIS